MCAVKRVKMTKGGDKPYLSMTWISTTTDRSFNPTTKVYSCVCLYIEDAMFTNMYKSPNTFSIYHFNFESIYIFSELFIQFVQFFQHYTTVCQLIKLHISSEVHLFYFGTRNRVVLEHKPINQTYIVFPV